MKKLFLVTVIMVFAAGIYAQGDLDNAFYFRFGYSKPTKAYGGIDNDDIWDDMKRNGIMFELGHIFYFNSLKMADGLRLGLNADYLNMTYHSIKHEEIDNIKSRIFLFGSKIGPVISYSPVDKLVFDAFVKLNPVWVSTLVDDTYGNESEVFVGFMGIGYSFGINVRYSILMVGFDFNKSWNKMRWIDDDGNLSDDIFVGNASDNDKDYTPVPNFNISIGLAF